VTTPDDKMQPKPKKITMFRFIIDLNEKFPQLVRAPVLEAVIHWEAKIKTDNIVTFWFSVRGDSLHLWEQAEDFN
jgi:phage baseplate assembly protein W